MPKLSLADEWMNALFGEPVTLAPALHWQLSHQLLREACMLSQWQVSVGEPVWLQFSLHLLAPRAQESVTGSEVTGTESAVVESWREAPRVLLSPDGCWPHVVSPGAMQSCLDQGVALAWFDRLDFAHDLCDGLAAQRRGAFYAQHPGSASGCLRVWAWGLSLAAQVLRNLMPQVKIGVIGHSRGGKAALLAGSLDAKIDAVMSHNSGAGGAASLAVLGAGAESLTDLAAQFPHWLGSQAPEPAVQARLREIDCTPLWARIAPRPLLILQAQGDAWANPLGTRHVHAQLTAYWQAAGAADGLALMERTGGHAMQESDWQAAAQFMRHPHAAWA